MKRQLTTFAFAGFLGLCCIGCPPAEEEPGEVDTDTEVEVLSEDDIDTGADPLDDDSNTTAADGETTGLEFPT
ncbi:MAG: hypothetical protein WD119_02050, partial [Pirellulaceae bacterium]